MKSFYKLLMVFLALAMAIPPAWATTDVITASDLAATGTSLAYFTNVSKPSGAVYAGRTAKHSSGAIILTTSSSNSGIVSTTSGGKIKSITFTFNQNTDKYGIQVYGKNTAYSSSSDLTDASTKGTLLGTTTSLTTVINVNGDYEYVGIISNNTSSSSKIILDNIQFEWESGTSITITPENQTIDDAAAGILTIEGNGVDGNINASLATNTDWYLNPTTFSGTGGEASISYTGRNLSASNTVTATAANDNTVTASATVDYVADLYIVTDNGVQDQWDFTNGTHMTNNNGTYTATFTANLDNTYILFARKLGNDVTWNTRLVFGPNSGGDWWLPADGNGSGTIDLNDDDPIKIQYAGTYTITINSDGTFTIAKQLEQVATPTFNPAEGTFTEAQSVTISCATSGATIYYTTDGSTPTTSSAVYSTAIAVSATTTIKAIAVKSGMSDSEVATATYTINTSPSGQTGEVTVGDASTYTYQLPAYYPSYYAQTNQMIYPESSLTDMVGCEITGIKFYVRDSYTMNFSGTYSMALGTTAQTSYSSAAPITGLTDVVTTHTATTGVTEFDIEFDVPFNYTGGNLVVQFQVNSPAPNNFTNTYWAGTDMGYNVGYYSQYSGLVQVLPKATFTYASTTPSVATPVFSPEGGTYNSVQTITITCATDGATISYSTDGGNTWTPYTGAITVSETTTITAKAEKNGMTASEATAEYIIDIPEDYDVIVTPDGGTIDFGIVDNEANATRSKTITVKNVGLNAVTPALSALTAPFSTDYVPAVLASGEQTVITITFAPTAEGTFSQEATLTFGRGIEARNFTLTGKGGKYDENDHSEIYDYDYTWTDANGTHTSNLLETATEPEQIIAMLREVYINPDIPGNKVRGYTENLVPESLTINGDDAFAVNYSAVGQLDANLQYVDQYGWNIPTNKSIKSVTKGSYTYNYMDPTEYTPNEEGISLIMLELKDGANYSGNSSYYSFGSSSLSLRDKVANTFKSARIITNWKHSGSGEEAGTLFKIDADKLNRFFFLAKGQLRIIDHSQAWENTWSSTNVVPFPSRKGSTFTDNTFNESSGGAVLAPFEHMFEQFSPNQASSATSAKTDVYQDLINMVSYDVVHDCVSIPYVGGNHEFNMYGVDSESDDCQDVRDMMFFVPDYRMKFWRVSQYSFGDDIRDPNSSEKFVNYNRDHQPTLGLYVIHQNEITGEQKNDNAYELDLSWQSNLLDFLPSDEGQYFLYRVIIDENGNKTYEPVVQVDENGDTIKVNGQPVIVTLDPNTTTYTDYVQMQEGGQVVTYVVQGQDATQFLSLQMSNEQSFIIPGTDKTSLLGLAPNGYHYSRFEPETETNYYANQLKLNRLATYIKGAYLGSGAKFTFKRSIDGGTNWTSIAEAVSNGSGTLTVTMQNQRVDGQYTHNNVDWIKMQNPSSVTYTVNASTGYADLSNLVLFDNIAASVLGNNHPLRYTYKVELEASQNLDDTDTNLAHSNLISYMIHKTEMDIQGYTKQDVDEDIDHLTPADPNRTVEEQVKYSSKQEILRYDAYRWKDDAEKLILDFGESTFVPTWNNVTVDETDIAPAGQANNQGDEYTIKIDAVNKGSVAISSGQTTDVAFVDTVAVMNAGLYTYAPVVETFTFPRTDYNTYGAPLQQTGVSKVGVEVGDYTINLLGDNPVWEENDNKYCHYTVKLKLTPINVPDGYELYKVRAWRQVQRSLLNEQVFPKNPERNRDYRLTASGEYMMEEINYPDFSKSTTDRDYQLGQSAIEQGTPRTEEVRATFGAQKLRTEAGETGTIEQLPMHFIVRAYYTREANLTSAGTRDAAANAAADGKYYIAEATCDFTFYANDTNNHTGVNSVIVDRSVTSVTYYNMMGQASDRPFDGMNIIVTRYSDGTTSTAKVIK